MRYRRLSYRYSLVLSTAEPRPLGLAELAGRAGVQLAHTCWRPAADVYETAGEIRVTVELAGVDHEELDVQLYEDAVIVEGRRRLPSAEAEGVYHAAEIRQGPFRLAIALPATFDPQQVSAHYERGLLLMTLPKPEGGRPA